MWSPLEYGCHVRDVYRICDGRLELMLSRGRPDVPQLGPGRDRARATLRHAGSGAVAVELASRGHALADRFDGVSGEQWARPGTRSDGARFTVESFARYVVHDVVHHLVDV